MAGLAYENLPAQREEPSSILKQHQDRQYKYLQDQYANEAKALERTPFANKGEFDRSVNELNTKYTSLVNKFRLKSQEESAQLQQIQSLVDQGNISEVAGREAAWRSVLPPEQTRAMFPKGEEVSLKPFSMSELRGGIHDSIVSFAGGAELDKKWYLHRKRESKTKEGLISQYAKWRDLLGYESLNPMRQHQLDVHWDGYMRSDKRFDEWWADEKQDRPIAVISASRPASERISAIRKKFGGSLTSAAHGTSPLGNSVIEGKVTGRKTETSMDAGSEKLRAITTKPPSPEELRRANTGEAFETGVKLGYWNR